ncbi:MAG: hypothetical protein QME32_08210 [Endomicrobiia bacterium]|nr:hypothetical protein [Endomicrobiia bacterium]
MAFAGVAEPAGASSVILNPSSLAVAEENEASAGLANGAVSGINLDTSYTRIFRGFAPASALFSKNLSSREFAVSAAFGRPERFDFLPGFSWGARAGAVADYVGEIKPDFTLGAQFPVDVWRLGAAITGGGESASARLGGATYVLDEYLVAADIDTKSKIYLGFETGVYGALGRVRAGFNTRDEAVSVGFGAYLWPYALDVYYMVPFEIKSSGRFGFSFVCRFGGYNFSQVLLERNTEKTMYLEKRISDSKAELSTLNKKLLETEEAYRKARDFVDILDSEASEIIKQKLKLMKGPAVEPAPSAPPPARPASSAPAPKRVWPFRHRAAAGDSLRSLAQQYYGDANKWQKIYDANRNKIERGLPKLGEDIVIPAP